MTASHPRGWSPYRFFLHPCALLLLAVCFLASHAVPLHKSGVAPTNQNSHFPQQSDPGDGPVQTPAAFSSSSFPSSSSSPPPTLCVPADAPFVMDTGCTRHRDLCAQAQDALSTLEQNAHLQNSNPQNGSTGSSNGSDGSLSSASTLLDPLRRAISSLCNTGAHRPSRSSPRQQQQQQQDKRGKGVDIARVPDSSAHIHNWTPASTPSSRRPDDAAPQLAPAPWNTRQLVKQPKRSQQHHDQDLAIPAAFFPLERLQDSDTTSAADLPDITVHQPHEAPPAAQRGRVRRNPSFTTTTTSEAINLTSTETNSSNNNNNNNNNNNSNNSNNNNSSSSSSSSSTAATPSYTVLPTTIPALPPTLPPGSTNRSSQCTTGAILTGSCYVQEDTPVFELIIDEQGQANVDALREALQRLNFAHLVELEVRGSELLFEQGGTTVDAHVLHTLLNQTAWADVVTLRLRNATLQLPLDLSALQHFYRLSDLSGTALDILGLTRSSPEPYPFEDTLQRIDVSRCGIGYLDENVFHGLVALEELNLQFNAIDCVSTGHFKGLFALQLLDLWGNRILNLPPGVFADLGAVRYLDLDSNRIGAVTQDAFKGLTSCEVLYLLNNRIGTLPAHAFASIPNLQLLQLDSNRMSQLGAIALQGVSRLHTLTINDNRLSSIDPEALTHAPTLLWLLLQNNRLSSLPNNVFASLPALTRLDLTGNQFTQLPSALTLAPQLDVLLLGRNHIAHADPAVLLQLRALRLLELNHNRLTELREGALPTSLLDLYLHNNRLTHVAETAFDNSSSLQFLWLSNNRDLGAGMRANLSEATPGLLGLAMSDTNFQHMSFVLPLLTYLDLRNNPTARLPPVSDMPWLQVLLMHGHMMPLIHARALNTLQLLETLDLTVRSGHTCELVAEDDDLAWPRLTSLALEGVRLPLEKLSNLQTGGLHTLHLGHTSIDDDTLSRRIMCGWLAPNVREIKLTGTSIRNLRLCSRIEFDNVLLHDSRELQSVSVPSDVRIMDVSDSPKLARIQAPLIRTLNISNTGFTDWDELCNTIGTLRVILRGSPSLVQLWRRDPELFQKLLQRCVGATFLFDISNNAFDDPHLLSSAIGGFVISESDLRANHGDGNHSQTVTLLQTENAPVTCNLRKELTQPEDVLGLEGPATALAFGYECECARDHKMQGGKCVKRQFQLSPGAIAGIVIGILVALGVGALIPYLFKRMHRKYRKQVAERESLLKQRDEEVESLKRGWEINERELEFVEKISEDTAAGVVWKARWEGSDNSIVAVKVLKTALLEFGGDMVQDFEKEIDFLQRFRHKHLVRFFGAGKLGKKGEPFLVLEFMKLGSLHSLLHGQPGFSATADAWNKSRSPGHRNTLAIQEEHADGSVHVTLRYGRRKMKLKFLREVASGMAFIHSVERLHRDLKSGNVLISANMVAKVADFGTAKLALQEHVHEPASEPCAVENRNMSMDIGTPLYMAPEMMEKRHRDAKLDVFSFGVLMWEIAMEKTPDLIEQEYGKDYTLHGPLLGNLLQLLTEGRRLTFPDHFRALHSGFDQLAQRCMEWEPAHRPSFDEILPALSRLPAVQEPSPRPKTEETTT